MLQWSPHGKPLTNNAMWLCLSCFCVQAPLDNVAISGQFKIPPCTIFHPWPWPWAGPGFCPFNKTTLQATAAQPSRSWLCIWMSSLSIKGPILQFPELLLVRGLKVSFLLVTTALTVTSYVNYARNCNKSGNWTSINNSNCLQKSPGYVSPK